MLLRMPKEMQKRLDKFAKSEYRSQTSVILQSIKEFLEKRGKT